jgi:hypothetical protein
MSYKLEETRKSFERFKRKNKNLSATIDWPTAAKEIVKE